jgi:uncharacterized protein (TIGR02266 family)
MSDKRKTKRVPLKITSKVSAKDCTTCNDTVNISHGGLFISTPEPLDEGSEINLALQLPDGESVAIKGKVKWVRQNEKEGERAGMGIEFVGISEKDIKKIKKLTE